MINLLNMFRNSLMNRPYLLDSGGENKVYSVYVISVFLVVFASFGSMVAPVYTLDQGHDLGSQASFDYFAEEDFQYGKEVINNIGPYGYLHYSAMYSGIYYYKKLIPNLFLAAIAAILVSVVSWRIRGFLPKVLFLIAVFGYSNSELFPGLILFLIGLVLLCLQSENRFNYFVTTSLLIVAALLSLAKSTNTFFSIGVLGVFAAYCMLNRLYRLLAVSIFSFGAGVVFWWLLAGQKISNLSSFFPVL